MLSYSYLLPNIRKSVRIFSFLHFCTLKTKEKKKEHERKSKKEKKKKTFSMKVFNKKE